jgi:hypothetical protein
MTGGEILIRCEGISDVHGGFRPRIRLNRRLDGNVAEVWRLDRNVSLCGGGEVSWFGSPGS